MGTRSTVMSLKKRNANFTLTLPGIGNRIVRYLFSMPACSDPLNTVYNSAIVIPSYCLVS